MLKLAREILDNSVTVRQAVDEAYDNIADKEPSIRAFITVADKESVYERADIIQKDVDKGVYSDGDLAGIPIAVKDNICTRHLKTTCGSKILKDYISSYNATVIDKLESAGAIIIGKTNLDEFAFGSTTETSYFGLAHNPHDINRVSGGSSGGSAAAVASGEVRASLGSDTGGSVRLPAAYCGITGLKPTYGAVSRYGLIAYASSMDQIGILAKHINDCAAIYKVIAGRDDRDSTSVETHYDKLSADESTDISGMRIGIPKSYMQPSTDDRITFDDEIIEAVYRVANTYKNMGASVEEFDMPLTDYVVPTYYVIACAEGSSNLERYDGVRYGYRSDKSVNLDDMYTKTRTEGFGTEVKRRLMLGTFVLSSGYYDEYYLKACRIRRLIYDEYMKAFGKYDLILTPTSPCIPPLIDESLSDPISMYLEDLYTVPANLTGIPAVSFPCGRVRGMYAGAQLMAKHFCEKKLIDAVYMYETAVKL